MEVGVLVAEFAVDDGVSAATFGPDVELRIGLGWGLDAWVGLPVFVRSGRVDILDPIVAIKSEIGRSEAWTLAAMLETSLPVGTTERGVVTPAAFVLGERSVGAGAIGSQVGVVWDRGADRVDGVATVVALFPLAGAVSGYLEVVTETSADGPAVLGHVGATLGVGRGNVDLHGGFGVTDAASGPFVGIAGSVVF